ncbi:MAG: hypothetical protein WCE80_01765 [Acidimicrobiia bacterium]
MDIGAELRVIEVEEIELETPLPVEAEDTRVESGGDVRQES